MFRIILCLTILQFSCYQANALDKHSKMQERKTTEKLIPSAQSINKNEKQKSIDEKPASASSSISTITLQGKTIQRITENDVHRLLVDDKEVYKGAGPYRHRIGKLTVSLTKDGNMTAR